MIGRFPSVSVVVPAYNAERTIRECIDSLLALDYPRELFEIVVVDNASRDGTRAILESFGGAVRVVDETQRGPGAARNAGIRASSGDVVAFTDADCVVRRGWLQALIEPLTKPWVGVSGGRILPTPGANAVELFGEWVHNHKSALAKTPPAAVTMNWASRREVLEDVGLFDATFKRSSDAELAYRIGRAGYEFVYCPAAVVLHRNERSLLGLMREAWQHGFYIVPVRRRHADFLAAVQGKPVSLGGRRTKLYSRSFRLAKRVGSWMGRVRFARFADTHEAGAVEASRPVVAEPMPAPALDGRGDDQAALRAVAADGHGPDIVPNGDPVVRVDDDPDAPTRVTAARS